jgi:hypothetical protein
VAEVPQDILLQGREQLLNLPWIRIAFDERTERLEALQDFAVFGINPRVPRLEFLSPDRHARRSMPGDGLRRRRFRRCALAIFQAPVFQRVGWCFGRRCDPLLRGIENLNLSLPVA